MSESDSYVGKYCKQRLLGRGTFGEAWLVVSRQSGRWHLGTFTPLHVYTVTPLHLYIFTPSYLYTFTPLHLYTFTPLHLYTFTPLHLYTFTPLHLYTFIPLHLYTCTPVHRYTQCCSMLPKFGSSPEFGVFLGYSTGNSTENHVLFQNWSKTPQKASK